MNAYCSVAETAQRFKISPRRLQLLCETGRIPGATMISGVWLIPDDAKKPDDARFSTQKNTDFQQLNLFDDSDGKDHMTLDEVCRQLSVSVATGNNWVRLGKLIPDAYNKRGPLFSKTTIEKLVGDIENKSDGPLKRRRNKKHITGSVLYRDYIEDPSKNIEMIEELLSSGPTRLIHDHIRLILAEYAIQLIVQAHLIKTPGQTQLLSCFVNGSLQLGMYDRLIRDLTDGCEVSEEILHSLSFALSRKVSYIKGQDFLGFAYLSFKNIGDRKAAGAYYTPVSIVQKMVDAVIGDSLYETGKTVLDPCCGTGNFLMYFSKYIDDPSMLHGQDIDPISVAITRINLALLYSLPDIDFLFGNITCGDTLKSLPEDRYDIIIGNPPWGYHFSEEEISALAVCYFTAVPKGIESYDIFLENAIAHLSDRGVVSFVLPESVLNVKSHTLIRQFILKRAFVHSLSYLGDAFNQVQCPAVILTLTPQRHEFSTKGIKVSFADRAFVIHTERELHADYFNLNITDQEYICLSKLEHTPGCVRLANHAEFALGIVTGSNKEYLRHKAYANCEPILKGRNILKYKILPADTYVSFVPSDFQQVAPAELYRAREKLLYRFICDSLVFAYDDQGRLTLNSCNIVIPHLEGLSIKYILAVLNSRPAQFYCEKKFNSVKLLRSHIEQIPIPTASREQQEAIVKKIDRILSQNEEVCSLYEIIDEEIMDLYRLTSEERKTIRESLQNKNLFLS